MESRGQDRKPRKPGSGAKPGTPFYKRTVSTKPYRVALERQYGQHIPLKKLAAQAGFSRTRLHELLNYQDVCTEEVAATLQVLIDNGPGPAITLSRTAAASQALSWWRDRMEDRPEAHEAHWGRVSLMEALGLSSEQWVPSMLRRAREDDGYRGKIEATLWRIAFS